MRDRGRIPGVRLGIAHHLGWAVAVTSSPELEVVDRRRIELIEPGLPTAPIHHEGGPHEMHRSGEPLDDEALASAGGRGAIVGAPARRRPRSTRSRPTCAAPIVSISLRSWPTDFPTDIRILRQVPYESRADSVMYLEILGTARPSSAAGRSTSTTRRPWRRRLRSSWATAPTTCCTGPGPPWDRRGRRTIGWHSPPPGARLAVRAARAGRRSPAGSPIALPRPWSRTWVTVARGAGGEFQRTASTGDLHHHRVRRRGGVELPVAGFALIEADTLEDAIALVADSPCAVATASSRSGPSLSVPRRSGPARVRRLVGAGSWASHGPAFSAPSLFRRVGWVGQVFR